MLLMLHLNKFIERVRGHDSRGAKDFVMSMSDAKDLHADITRLLLELHNLRESAPNTQENEVITIKMDGGSF